MPEPAAQADFDERSTSLMGQLALLSMRTDPDCGFGDKAARPTECPERRWAEAFDRWIALSLKAQHEDLRNYLAGMVENESGPQLQFAHYMGFPPKGHDGPGGEAVPLQPGGDPRSHTR
jgi:hypothetical protein